jgi:hypothetical protein
MHGALRFGLPEKSSQRLGPRRKSFYLRCQARYWGPLPGLARGKPLGGVLPSPYLGNAAMSGRISRLKMAPARHLTRRSDLVALGGLCGKTILRPEAKNTFLN